MQQGNDDPCEENFRPPDRRGSKSGNTALPLPDEAGTVGKSRATGKPDPA
jgi:hypothetical protein